MKTITPVTSWTNGQSVEATLLNAYVSNLILGTSAVFHYSLFSEELGLLNQGSLTMDGADYQTWSDDEIAWDWIASKLNLTITGDYNESPE
jgi:hypothetical protein